MPDPIPVAPAAPDPATQPPGVAEMMAQSIANLARRRVMQTLALQKMGINGNFPAGRDQPEPMATPVATIGIRG